METAPKKVLIGVAWPYVNGDIHVGHLAGYLLPCDIFARACRLQGYDTLMVSGTDCHGTPITVEADKRGITPEQLVREYTPKVHELIALYGTSYDIFTSTTTQNHREVTQEIFLNLLKNGYVSKRTSQQYYSESERRFLPDRYVEGECSYCHAPEQRGDQCESCGRTLAPGELINPKSKLAKTPVALKETEHYFIDYDKLQTEIGAFVEQSTWWRDWVRSEALGWIREGLQPRAVTRDIDWGIAIPTDRIPERLRIKGSEHKRFYVWFEAVIGYLSAAREWAQLGAGRSWEEYWKNPACRHYYFMGKDNLAFHTLFWPGQLIGQRSGYNLPYFPAINHFLNLEGKKFSKSRGVHIDSIKVGKYFGADAVRFYVSLILPEANDANWQWKEFQEAVNGELVGNIGNFIHRTLTFYRNKLGGTIKPANRAVQEGLTRETENAFKSISSDVERCSFVSALKQILAYSREGNRFFDEARPWATLSTDRDRTERDIYACIQRIYSLRALLSPFIPHAMDRLSGLLGVAPLDGRAPQRENAFMPRALDLDRARIAETIEPLFKRIEDEDIKTFTGQ